MRLLNGMQPLPPTPENCVDTIAYRDINHDLHANATQRNDRMFGGTIRSLRFVVFPVFITAT